MHQRLQLSRHEPVIDEKILLDVKFRIPPLQIARTVIFYAMSQDKILRSRWGAYGIRLQKLHPMQRSS
jgi:hypothetical protein